MAINPGIYPLVPGTPVGDFRLATGDTQSVPFLPPEPGIRNYTYASDAEIQTYLAKAAGNQNGAIGYYYLTLAGAAAVAAKSIKDYDLSLSTEKRANDLRAQAEFYFGLADRDAALTGVDESFDIGPTGTNEERFVEYFPYPYPLDPVV